MAISWPALFGTGAVHAALLFMGPVALAVRPPTWCLCRPIGPDVLTVISIPAVTLNDPSVPVLVHAKDFSPRVMRLSTLSNCGNGGAADRPVALLSAPAPARIDAPVSFCVRVSASGELEAATARTGRRRNMAAARRTLAAMRFSPAVRDGAAVAAWTVVTMRPDDAS